MTPAQPSERPSKKRRVDSPMAQAQVTGAVLDQGALHNIFSHLSSAECAQASTVCKTWNDVACDDRLWRAYCLEDLFIDTPVTPWKDTCPSFREAYRVWRTEFGHYKEHKVGARAFQAWRGIEAWTAEHFPAVYETLKGAGAATEEALDMAEKEVGHALPPALRALYRIQDGQHLEGTGWGLEGRPDQPNADLFKGVFGGYRYYDHLVSFRMAPIEIAVCLTKQLARFARAPVRHFLVMAASFYWGSREFNKLAAVDLETGHMIVLQATHMGWFCACPPDSVEGAQDGALRWLEDYQQQMSAGQFGVGPLLRSSETASQPELMEMTRTIVIFPRQPPQMVESITHFVRVRVSTLFVPERSDERHPMYEYTYSLRLSLLSEDEQRRAWGGAGAASRVVTSVQLQSRHWVMRGADGSVEDEISGDGVIGLFPLLRAGAEEFVYESCTRQSAEGGSMEGFFTFVEGSLANPISAEFNVEVPRFEMRIPAFIH